MLTATHPGGPSHALLLPEGVIRLVEIRNRTFSASQKAWHDRARELGTTVVVIQNKQHLVRWFARLSENMAPQPGRPGRPSKEMALAKHVANRCAELNHDGVHCGCMGVIEDVILPWKRENLW